MDEEFLAQPPQEELFEVELELIDSLGEAVRSYGPGVTKSPEGFEDKHRVSIGQPIAYPLVDLFKLRGQDLPAQISLQLQKYEFYLVELTCIFDPAQGSRFADATFGAILYNLDPNSALEDVMAYDLAPSRVQGEVTVNRKFSISPNVKFKFEEVSPEFSLFSRERSESYINYQSQIEAIGLQTNRPTWKFTRTNQQEIGRQQELFMIVRKPRGTQVTAKFTLSGHIEDLLFNKFPFSTTFRKQGQVVQQPTEVLC